MAMSRSIRPSVSHQAQGADERGAAHGVAPGARGAPTACDAGEQIVRQATWRATWSGFCEEEEMRWPWQRRRPVDRNKMHWGPITRIYLSPGVPCDRSPQQAAPRRVGVGWHTCSFCHTDNSDGRFMIIGQDGIICGSFIDQVAEIKREAQQAGRSE
jgi:hypothetical protein